MPQEVANSYSKIVNGQREEKRREEEKRKRKGENNMLHFAKGFENKSAAMKGGSSSLNPYATSYVPLSERGGTDDINDFRLLSNQLDSGNHSVWFGHQPNLMCTEGQHQNLSQSYVNGADAVQVAQISNPKDHCGGEFYAPSSYNPYEMSGKSRFSEESDLDLAYLQMTFPGISEESLSDVYLTNKCDLDSTVDMLNQLEIYPEFFEKLPDTLDIGDVPESGSSNEVASQKLKNVTGKARASTSGSSISASAS